MCEVCGGRQRSREAVTALPSSGDIQPRQGGFLEEEGLGEAEGGKPHVGVGGRCEGVYHQSSACISPNITFSLRRAGGGGAL